VLHERPPLRRGGDVLVHAQLDDLSLGWPGRRLRDPELVASGRRVICAGLDLGGGKAVIIGDPAEIKTEPLLRAYGRFVASLGGRYVTACDVGTRSEDMDIVARECRYVTGRTIANGGAGDSSVLTALGVMHGMRAAAQHAWGDTSLRGRTVGVEGVGKVGHRLVDHLVEAGAEIEEVHRGTASLEEAFLALTRETA